MNNTGKVLTGLAIGIGAGVALGYFLNSEKGQEYVSDVKDKAGKYAGNVKDKAEEYAGKVKHKFDKSKAGEYAGRIKHKVDEKAEEAAIKETATS